MQNPEVYICGNGFQLRGAQELLSNYFHLIQWKEEGEVVMDLGCGPGSATCDVLKKMLPENCGPIYAVDIEERMVEFGRKNYPEINFVKSDVRSPEFIAQFQNSVDHVFSFYLFQLLDQRILAQTLFEILKPGGDILTVFPAVHPLGDVYTKMLKMEKWKGYKKDMDYVISVYQFHKNIEESQRKFLTEAGFNVLMCKCENITFVYESLEELKNFILGIHPLQKYSDNIQQSFMSEVMEQILKVDSVRQNGSQIILSIKILSFCARKP